MISASSTSVSRRARLMTAGTHLAGARHHHRDRARPRPAHRRHLRHEPADGSLRRGRRRLWDRHHLQCRLHHHLQLHPPLPHLALCLLPRAAAVVGAVGALPTTCLPPVLPAAGPAVAPRPRLSGRAQRRVHGKEAGGWARREDCWVLLGPAPRRSHPSSLFEPLVALGGAVELGDTAQAAACQQQPRHHSLAEGRAQLRESP